ncbi:MAG: hypothetical protein WC829_08195 [Hyphomicrobium sp.]|jgi:hypothetical protein
MGDSCNCAQCPHHCGDEENNADDDAEKEAQKKLKNLEDDIQALGFKTEEGEDGIKVTM